MKRICLALSAVMAAAAGGRAGDFTPATPVDEATVAAARASAPKTDDAAVRARIAAGLVGTWVSDGRIPGKVIFEETFERGWGPFTRRGGGSRIREDGRGGHSVELSVTPTNAYVSVCTEWGKAVRIDPKRLMAVLWEARTEHGGVAPLFVIDYCDAKGRRIRNPNCPSSVLADQPTMFHRNAWSLGDQVPAEARSAHLQFCVGKHALGRPCEFANVRLVDLTDAVDAALASERAVRAARASAPADAVLVYADDNLTATYPVLPDGAAMPGAAGAPLRLRECPGERTRATAILWSKTAHADVTVSFSDLKKDSDLIPSSALYAKIVKVHYQAAGAPNGMLVLADDQTLVPELLLNDDSLVVPDHRTHRNLVRHRWNGRTWYADINTIATKNFFTAPKAEELPIVDAKTLQPFDLPAGQNRQLMIRLAVPAGAKVGRYRGEVTFASRGRKVAALPVELEVLPFGLPKLAETVYDPNRVFEMGLYVWPYVRKDGQATLSPLGRSREQVLGEFRALVDNGITSPAFCWDAGLINDERRFREHLAILREAGFPGKTLHLGATGMLCKPKVYGVPLTDPEGLKEMQSRLVKAMAVARDYGFEEVYFYGIDEAKKDTVLAQIPAWKAAHEVGAKVMVSGYRGHFEMVGDVLDLIVYADDAAMEDVRPWHANGARLWKYNTPQTGPEDPGIYRRNYGLDLWRRGFDGANTYCDIGSSSAWNDLSGLQRLQRAGKPGANAYRTLCLFYPTVDGIVETLALTGFESAIKDVRVLTKFRQLLRAHPNAAAQAWFDRLNPGSDDLVRVRREAIDWILRLESAPAAGCPDFDTASAWVTGVRWACGANKDRKSPPPVFKVAFTNAAGARREFPLGQVLFKDRFYMHRRFTEAERKGLAGYALERFLFTGLTDEDEGVSFADGRVFREELKPLRHEPVGPAPFPTREKTVQPIAASAKAPCAVLPRFNGRVTAGDPTALRVTERREGRCLVVDLSAPAGAVREFTLGFAHEAARVKRIVIPGLPYGEADELAGGYFRYALLDWYVSNASDLVERTVDGEPTTVVRYRPKTDGTYNPLRERVVITLSDDFADVLPEIPNPPSPHKAETGTRVWRSHAAFDRARDKAFWQCLHDNGIRRMAVTDHETMWRDGGESFTFVTEAAKGKGGDAAQRDFTRFMIDTLGYVYGPYNNYTDYSPNNARFWDIDNVARNPDGSLVGAWMRCYSPKPTVILPLQERIVPEAQAKFGFNGAYCDVHTAVAPWGRTDYDARCPGAGMFATVYYAWGKLLLRQRELWNGPVWSEGARRFMYAGLTDGNYAQDWRIISRDLPWIVDFDLLKIHPLECDFGMGSLSMFSPGKTDLERQYYLPHCPDGRDALVDSYIGATLAFGHAGYLIADWMFDPPKAFGLAYCGGGRETFADGLAIAKRSYFMTQAIAARYTQETAEEIRYFDASGAALTTSEAIRTDAVARRQIYVRYTGGVHVLVNGSVTERLKATVGGVACDLPPRGYRAWTEDGTVLVESGDNGGKGPRRDYARGPDYTYDETRER